MNQGSKAIFTAKGATGLHAAGGRTPPALKLFSRNPGNGFLVVYPLAPFAPFAVDIPPDSSSGLCFSQMAHHSKVRRKEARARKSMSAV